MKGVNQVLNFNKYIADSDWEMFTTMLQYKLMNTSNIKVKVF
ncbi:hypothetical protein HMPREF0202_02870 [Cetobacterium somerae ATCC BAA-474]|uniref:Transposase n=1 Tax=Cetobacterium somerae ATCC BAA-474 TaxID=1319815 RepID=U7UZC9_9FUSO|nr:hypothetical protein HMPREF0202_02870 [Cetobacterium somerae ATCC BAA-474]